MSLFKEKISNLVTSQLPEFVVEDHPKFVEFLKAYYTFMEASLLEVTEVETTDGLQLESEILENTQVNLLLLNSTGVSSEITLENAGEKLLFESSAYGKFTVGEIVQGQTSKALSTILSVDINKTTNTGKIFILAQDKFLKDEVIIGLTSNASAVINNYKPNPVTSIQQLLNLRDVDKTLDNFLSHFRNELVNTLPETLTSEINKREFYKNAYYFYSLKGTPVGNDLFFRILFNEKAETIYPRDNILRASDGKWEKNNIIRVSDIKGDTYNLLYRQITGTTSFATAIVQNIIKIIIGGELITEIVLDPNNINGTFLLGETIKGTSNDTDDTYITASVLGIPADFEITNGGSLYSFNQIVDTTTNNNTSVQIDKLNTGSIENIIIDVPGIGYSIGDDLIFDNTGTYGKDAAGFVKIVNGGFKNEDNSNDRIILEDFTQNGDSYDGSVLVQENANGSGDITDIFLYNKGNSYTSLPTITISSNSGINAKIKCFGSNIGKVQSIKFVEEGAGYTTPSVPLKFKTNLLITSLIGSFIVDETVTTNTGITGKVVSFNLATGLLVLKNTTSTIYPNYTVTGNLSNATGTITIATEATGNIIVGTVRETDGSYFGTTGLISESSMIIQDNKKYQDYSYVVKVGRTINEWRSDFIKSIHPAGFYFEGEVDIQSFAVAKTRAPIIGEISKVVQSPLFSILNTLFLTTFRRKLGTIDDGSTLNLTPLLGKGGDLNQQTGSQFLISSRDMTLRRSPVNLFYISRLRYLIGGIDIRKGYAYSGPSYRTINREVDRSFVRQVGTNYTIGNLSNNLTFNTDSIYDGKDNHLLFCSNDAGRNIKARLTIPAEIVLIVGKIQFDSDIVKMDQTIDRNNNPITFDSTRP